MPTKDQTLASGKPISWTLQISKDLSLALDYVTRTCAILGKKRRGKSYKAGVIAEEILAAGKQVIIFDPTGAWWGLRSSADGLSPGYPITIIGGLHGDLPLDPKSGAELAASVVGERFSVIIDLSGLDPEKELPNFLADFALKLYEDNVAPVHVFADEANMYCPENPETPAQARSLRAFRILVRQGGIKGIGITLVSQRPAEVSKGVLSQIDTLIVIGMTYNRDIEAIERWVKEHSDPNLLKEIRRSLPSLERGDAWVWDPERDVLQRVTFRDKRTFDSGRTPDVHEEIVPPKALAKVDLDRLGKRLAKVVDEAKQNDPTALRARVAELEAVIAKGSGAVSLDHLAMIAKVGKERDDLRAQLNDEMRMRREMEEAQERVTTLMDAVLDELGTVLDKPILALTGARNHFVNSLEDVVAATDAPPVVIHETPVVRESAWTASVRETVKKENDDRSIAFLVALQTFGAMGKARILMQTGYAQSGKASDAFADLSKRGFVEDMGGGMLAISNAGRAYLRTVKWSPLPQGDDLYLRVLDGKRLDERGKAFLRVLHDVYPEAIGKGDVLKRTQFAQSGKASDAFADLVRIGYAVKAGAGQLRLAMELTNR